MGLPVGVVGVQTVGVGAGAGVDNLYPEAGYVSDGESGASRL